MRYLFNSPIGARVAPLGVPKNVLSAAAATLLAAGIGATAGAVNTGINSWQADLAENKSFNRQKELMDKQLEQSKDLHKTNLEESYRQELAVNSPSAQMARYREAGLNPYLIMQHEGNIGAAASPSVGTPNAPGAPSVNQRHVIPLQGIDFGGLSNLLVASSEAKRNESQTLQNTIDFIEKVGKNLGWPQARSLSRELLGVNGIQNSQTERMVESVIRQNELDSERLKIENDLTSRFGAKQAQKVLDVQQAQIDEYFAKVDKLFSDIDVNNANLAEIQKRIDVLASEYVRNLAQAFASRKEGEKFVVDAEYYKSMKALTDTSVQREEFNNYFNQTYVGSSRYNYAKKFAHHRSLVENDKQLDNWKRSALGKALDKALGQYLKVSGGIN